MVTSDDQSSVILNLLESAFGVKSKLKSRQPRGAKFACCGTRLHLDGVGRQSGGSGHNSLINADKWEVEQPLPLGQLKPLVLKPFGT